MTLRVMCVFGTRPEAIKMAPVVRALRARSGIDTVVCVTGQHREMLDQVLDFFEIVPDHDLAVMRPDQRLAEVTAAVLTGVAKVIAADRPDVVLVQGDTSTTLAAALAAHYAKVPVGHVEAGLRTGDIWAPWPEEMNRRLTADLASVHLAPTERARDNLIREGVDATRIHVTGNTVVDALLWTRDRVSADPEAEAHLRAQFDFLDPARRLLLVTGHRRESFGAGFERICHALVQLADRDDVEVLYPVHLNPRVRASVEGALSGHPSVHLVDPVDYPTFVYLMDRSYLILTDSGGIQEEAPSLGKPVLVLRERTERMEAVDAGTVLLVGTRSERIVEQTTRLLDSPESYASMSAAHNPYGDGRSAPRVVDILEAEFATG